MLLVRRVQRRVAEPSENGLNTLTESSDFGFGPRVSKEKSKFVISRRAKHEFMKFTHIIPKVRQVQFEENRYKWYSLTILGFWAVRRATKCSPFC